MFGSTAGFSRSADRMALFPVLPNSRNGDISVADHPIYSVYGSSTGFSGSADRMALFPVSLNSRWSRHLYILKNSNGDISAADHPIYSVFGSRMGFFEVGRSNGAIFGFAKFSRYVTVRENNVRGVSRLVTI